MTDQFFMEKALEQALQAYEQDEVPIGAILVSNLHIIGRGQNQTEHLQDITAHAEMIAMSAGFELLGSKYLEDCTLYVTLEPCVMCAGALKTKLEYGLLESECSAIIKQFFKSKRK